MFREKPIQFPDENPVLGRYLGSAVDAVLAITAKIMKVNGEVFHQSTYRALKENYNPNLAHISLQN